MAGMRAYRSKVFKRWYETLSQKDKRVVDARIDLARTLGILNNYKELDSKLSLFEFKWKCGMRIYFSLLQDSEGNLMLLLTGGNKNSQSKDITESKKLIKKAMKSIEDKNG